MMHHRTFVLTNEIRFANVMKLHIVICTRHSEKMQAPYINQTKNFPHNHILAFIPMVVYLYMYKIALEQNK